MIINVFSYQDALESIKNGNTKNWISIRDTGYSYLYQKIDQLCQNVLQLYFDDVRLYDIKNNLLHPFYDKKYKRSGLITFDESHAEQIKEFVEGINRINQSLNIHCFAGKSRSQAIFNVLNVYYNLYLNYNKKDFIENLNLNNENFMGNSDVIKIMQEVFYQVK